MPIRQEYLDALDVQEAARQERATATKCEEKLQVLANKYGLPVEAVRGEACEKVAINEYDALVRDFPEKNQNPYLKSAKDLATEKNQNPFLGLADHLDEAPRVDNSYSYGVEIVLSLVCIIVFLWLASNRFYAGRLTKILKKFFIDRKRRIYASFFVSWSMVVFFFYCVKYGKYDFYGITNGINIIVVLFFPFLFAFVASKLIGWVKNTS